MGKEKKSKNRKRSRSRSRDEKRSRKRHNSSSSSSSDDNKLESKLSDERSRRKKERKLEKQRLKDTETAEERMLRRKEKKLKKDQKRKAAVETSIPDELAYTNLNNPFNDTKLTETFVWGKKLEREGKSHLSRKEIEKEARKRIERNLHEAQEFKRVRDARLAAREDMDMMQRDADRREVSNWDSKEQQFQLDQAKERSRIRIAQNRAKAIDILSRYIRYGDEDKTDEEKKNEEEFELEDPLSCLKDLTSDDYEDLIEDIKVYRRLEDDKHMSFWTDVRTIVDDELKKRREEDGRREGIHGSLKTEVMAMFKGKTVLELCDLEAQISSRISKGGATNAPYWEGLLEHLKVYIARTRLRDLHGKMLRLKLTRIREEQMQQLNSGAGNGPSTSSQDTSVAFPKKEEIVEDDEDEDDTEELSKKVRRKVDVNELEGAELDDEQRELRWRQLTEDQIETVALELYERGRYSPPYNEFDDTMPGIEVIEESFDSNDLKTRRAKNLKKPAAEIFVNPNESKMIEMAKKGMDGDEATFAVEEQLETQKHLWSDKYRPRKPTYLNRVQTGFDWNKYNQTHYDMDNPPPKIVQGYKFNIFYPDLLDKTKTPTFTVTPCDDPDFAIVRFKAGPPYEDIAFKIVNREWEVLHKNGYKCQFQNGVFQLWFVFKRYRYRR